MLLTVAEPFLTVRHTSTNVRELLALDPGDVIGQPLEAVMGDAACRLVRTALDQTQPELASPLPIETAGRRFDGLVHRHRGVTIVELEPVDAEGPVQEDVDAKLRVALVRLQGAGSPEELLSIVVDEVRALTGFDRVMMYRFGRDGHGVVLEEARAPGVESFLGLHYPASDIPSQARALYVANWIRMIPDVEYTPVPIVPAMTGSERPIDLSFAGLRSVSPVHVEYLRNMGVRASTSISLVDRGRLRGLIACHHRQPRVLRFSVRSACELLGRMVSLQYTALENIAAQATASALRALGGMLTETLRRSPGEPTSGLVTSADALLRLVGASGAAIYNGEGLQLVGATPPRRETLALIHWIERRDAPIVETDALSRSYPPAQAFAPVASGLLAIMVPTRPPAYVLWFRQELVQTVTWAGEPSTPQADAFDRRIRPRRSFAHWRELVTGQSLPWLPSEREAAEDLRRSAIEADLARQIRRAESAIHLRDDLIAVVSHDLRSPLDVITMAARVLESKTEDPNVGRIGRAATTMNRLIGDLLDLAKIEEGRLTLTPRAVSVESMIEEAFDRVEAIAERRRIRLERASVGGHVLADPERVGQVLSNLLGNALKFTPSGGRVELRAELDGDEVRFSVTDTGPGMAKSEIDHVFDRYWQARRTAKLGTGLGLYICKGIVEAHGGRIWAVSELGRGSAFCFTLQATDAEEP